jgi:alanine racemase
MTLKSRIVEIKKIKKGEYAGYGPNFKAERDTVLGLVPVGYGDGYLRSLSNKGFAYLKGKRVKVVGNVSMKALYLDITDVESPQIGEEVILLGGENEEVSADELATLAGTISYELFCNLGKTIPKEYIDA